MAASQRSMQQTPRQAAREIWRAGVAAVQSDRLVEQFVRVDQHLLTIGSRTWPDSEVSRIVALGGGKAGAGMAAGLERALQGSVFADRLTGWLNVPDDCVRTDGLIRLHAARPAGLNEPTQAGIEGTRQILRTASELGVGDLCLVLLSGGGSALLPAPREGIELADKLAVTRLLMHSGATIDELNCVRRHLSDFKGGGLARICRAESRIALIISDVVGDPLDVIASGPTVPAPDTSRQALEVLHRFDPRRTLVPARVWHVLEEGRSPSPADSGTFENYLIGSNQVALEAAACRAVELGYEVRSLGSENRGVACETGRELAELALHLREHAARPVCVLSGGEPIVELSPSEGPRKGGRNQELALAALVRLLPLGLDGLAVLSGGTDGEDGPTDAAGAVVDEESARLTRQRQLDLTSALERHDSYPVLDACDSLIRTGPTHTNVMDLRVVVVHPPSRLH